MSDDMSRRAIHDDVVSLLEVMTLDLKNTLIQGDADNLMTPIALSTFVKGVGLVKAIGFLAVNFGRESQILCRTLLEMVVTLDYLKTDPDHNPHRFLAYRKDIHNGNRKMLEQMPELVGLLNYEVTEIAKLDALGGNLHWPNFRDLCHKLGNTKDHIYITLYSHVYRKASEISHGKGLFDFATVSFDDQGRKIIAAQFQDQDWAPQSWLVSSLMGVYLADIIDNCFLDEKHHSSIEALFERLNMSPPNVCQ